MNIHGQQHFVRKQNHNIRAIFNKKSLCVEDKNNLSQTLREISLDDKIFDVKVTV